MNEKKQSGRLMLIGSMAIFGTIGILRKYIPLSSSLVALARAVVGTLFLVAVLLIKGRKPDYAGWKRNLIPLLLSGGALGFNWIALFESYNHTSVATATLCYYLAPVIVILVSPLVLKEKLTGRKLVCAAVALAGMALVSGIFEAGSSIADWKGILFGLVAAALYASVVLLNKKISNLAAYDKTIFQLAVSTVTLLPYVLLTENPEAISLSGPVLALLLVAGIVHTGIAYCLYFGSMASLPAQTVALYSYIDPILAIVLSMVILHEPMTLASGIGAVMILGAALVSEQ